MKPLILILSMIISSLGMASDLKDFNGDYTLKLNVGACNSNARVEADSYLINIINQDSRDNRGWSTVNLRLGEDQLILHNGFKRLRRVSLVRSQVVVEESILKNGKEVSYQKDLYTFKDSNGKKSLQISLATQTRGHLSSYGTSCWYEKK